MVERDVRKGIPDGPIYGVVTTGILWRFLRLDGTDAAVDSVEYFLKAPGSIFGILNAMALGTLPNSVA